MPCFLGDSYDTISCKFRHTYLAAEMSTHVVMEIQHLGVTVLTEQMDITDLEFCGPYKGIGLARIMDRCYELMAQADTFINIDELPSKGAA